MSVQVLVASSEVVNSLSEESQVYKCQHCDEDFVKSKALRKHIKKNHDSEKDDNFQKRREPNECKYCDRSFRKERNLVLHVREDHDDDDLKDESVKFNIELKPVNKKSNECSECGIDYHIESELQRHMALRHTEITLDVPTNASDKNIDEKLLAQDDSETESLDEVVDGIDVNMDSSEFELDGESVSIEDVDFGLIDAAESLSVAVEESDGKLDSPNNSMQTDKQSRVDGVSAELPIDGVDQTEIEDPVDEESDEVVPFEGIDQAENKNIEEIESKGLVEVENDSTVPLNTNSEKTGDSVTDDSIDMELDGESIMMDDDAFDMLENAMQMTMTTPDDSEEDDIPLSMRRKRKSKAKVSKKNRRPSKKVKDDVEIVLDGEAVVEDLEVSDGDEILVVYEDKLKEEERDESSSDEDSGDDDPDFAPSKSFNKRSIPKRKSQRKISKNIKTALNSSTVSKTPARKSSVKEKFVGRTRISLVQGGVSEPVINSIPKSTRIVYQNGNTDKINIRNGNKVKVSNDQPQVTKKLLCSLCKKVFKSREQFDNHMTVEHKKHMKSEISTKKNKTKNIELQECEKCDASYPKKTMLDDHMKSAHFHKCSKCRQNFHSEISLKKHMPTHMIKCDKCSYAGESKIKVVEHKKAQHNFKCSKCNNRFDLKDKLDSHIRENHAFKCGKCNVVFEARSLLEGHNKRAHYFPCPHCTKVFDMKQRLKTHDKDSHQSCTECEDEFNWPEAGHTCYYTRNNIRPTF